MSSSDPAPGAPWVTGVWVRTYELAATQEDLLVAELYAIGTLGCEVRDLGAGRRRVLAYFDSPPYPHPRLPDPGQPGRAGLRWVEDAPVDSRDWLEEFRRAARPVAVGRRFLIDPGELSESPPVPSEGRFLLRLPARNAFGTGTHESTRLALGWLEALPTAGRTVLDVGTGSGILALAAIRLGAAAVVGFDLDLPSVVLAGQYGRLNEAEPRLFAGTVAALGPSAFDLMLVNVLPHRIRAQVPALASRLAPGGTVVVSGLLASEWEPVHEAWAAHGLGLRGRRTEGDWAALALERPG